MLNVSPRTPLFKGIVLMLFCTLFTAFGQLFLKYGSQRFSWTWSGIVLNPPLLVGLMLYGIGSVLLLIAFRHGALSVLYPFVSLTFIWVFLIAMVFFGESLNSFKINGIIMIIFGITFIGGSQNHGQ